MIEVNLIPGGKKRSAKKSARTKSRSFAFPGGSGAFGDAWVAGAVAAWIAALGAMAWFYVSIGQQSEEVEVAIAAEVQDSARFAELIEQVQGLIARRDSIIQRVDIIQSIDQDRYVWPHVLDEVARALPEYTWLTGMVQTLPPPDLQVQLTGQAGNNFAVAEFITRLSESPFVRVADFLSSAQAIQNQGEGGQQIVYDFTLEVYFQPPPPEILETVPLFDEGEFSPASAAARGG